MRASAGWSSARDSDGGPLCFACAPRPARLCGRCGRMAADRPPRPATASPTSATAASVRRWPHAGRCGRPKPCHFAGRRDRPICASCSPRAVAVCAHCRRAASARGPLARGPGVRTVLPRRRCLRRGSCEDCGQQRRLIAPPGPLAQRLRGLRRACRAAGRVCADCGIEDRLYHDGRCVRCRSHGRTSRLPACSAGPSPPTWSLSTTPSSPPAKPYTAHNWLRSAVAAQILAEIASGALPLTHEALDAHPRRQAARFLAPTAGRQRRSGRPRRSPHRPRSLGDQTNSRHVDDPCPASPAALLCHLAGAAPGQSPSRPAHPGRAPPPATPKRTCWLPIAFLALARRTRRWNPQRRRPGRHRRLDSSKADPQRMSSPTFWTGPSDANSSPLSS